MAKARIISKRSVNSVMNEKKFTSQLNHPFLVNMHYAFEDQNNLYLVIDLMSGGDLRYHIGRHRKFTEEQTSKYIRSLIKLQSSSWHVCYCVWSICTATLFFTEISNLRILYLTKMVSLFPQDSNFQKVSCASLISELPEYGILRTRKTRQAPLATWLQKSCVARTMESLLTTSLWVLSPMSACSVKDHTRAETGKKSETISFLNKCKSKRTRFLLVGLSRLLTSSTNLFKGSQPADLDWTVLKVWNSTSGSVVTIGMLCTTRRFLRLSSLLAPRITSIQSTPIPSGKMPILKPCCRTKSSWSVPQFRNCF